MTFAGEIDDASAYIRAADILVNTSRSEAFPRTFIEAAAGETAIIATAIDGALERLIDGQSALLYPPGDIAALRAHIAGLVGSQTTRARLARQAHIDLIESWTQRDTLDAYREEISYALGDARSGEK